MIRESVELSPRRGGRRRFSTAWRRFAAPSSRTGITSISTQGWQLRKFGYCSAEFLIFHLSTNAVVARWRTLFFVSGDEGDLPLAVPDLNSAPVNELLGLDKGGVVIIAMHKRTNGVWI
jgi:hypothetical protein